jgi:hypothetical protein
LFEIENAIIRIVSHLFIEWYMCIL